MQRRYYCEVSLGAVLLASENIKIKFEIENFTLKVTIFQSKISKKSNHIYNLFIQNTFKIKIGPSLAEYPRRNLCHGCARGPQVRFFSAPSQISNSYGVVLVTLDIREWYMCAAVTCAFLRRMPLSNTTWIP